MPVIWLNGTVGAGKTMVGLALAALLPNATFMDGDAHGDPFHRPSPARWTIALQALLRAASRTPRRTLVIAYPLEVAGYRKLKTVCSKAHRRLLIVTLATPLPIILRGRGHRVLDAWERARIRVMRSQGCHRRPFSSVTLPNAGPSPHRTAGRIARLARRMPLTQTTQSPARHPPQ